VAQRRSSLLQPTPQSRLGNGSNAPSLGGLNLGGSPVLLGSTATYDPIVVTRALWARWKSLDAVNKRELMRMGI
jgi:hypothetical protein